MPVPVFPLSPEGDGIDGIDGIDGMVPAPVEPAGGIVCIPPLGLEVSMPGMVVEELVLVEELVPAAVGPMLGIAVLEDCPEVGSMPLIEEREFDCRAPEESAPIAPMADERWT